ncbi:unnamed protein product [Candidula unifasciata]|uniref:Transmembrane protein 45B n=1 Tax=Candidula unifasciata TaxID=100452 RepID=A0A8S3ZS56_9EUPU|nr:unnamed protein product [Candidula unifasciata]
MGDLKGHIVPGTAFLLYGLWWAVGSIRRYFLCRKRGQQYLSTATFPCPFSCGNTETWPVEAVAEIVISSGGLFGEIFCNLPSPSAGIVQHATMYSFFAISGAVDLCMHFGFPLPPGTDYVALALAFLIEGFLFTNHLHEREILDVHIHVLLAYVVFLSVVVILLEARYQRSAMLTLSRTFLVMLQGSWFWAVGIIFWHCAVIFITLVIMATVMSLCYRTHKGSRFRDGSELPMTELESREKYGNYKLLAVKENEESDIEYEQPVKMTSVVARDVV